MFKRFILFIFIITILGCNSGRSLKFGMGFKYMLTPSERGVGLTEDYHQLYEKSCSFKNHNVILNKMILSDVASYIFIGIPFNTKTSDLISDLENSSDYKLLDRREFKLQDNNAEIFLLDKEGNTQVKLFISKEKESAVLTYYDSDKSKIKKLFEDQSYFAERIK